MLTGIMDILMSFTWTRRIVLGALMLGTLSTGAITSAAFWATLALLFVIGALFEWVDIAARRRR